MIFSRSAVTLPEVAAPILAQFPSDGTPPNGEFGFPIITALAIGGAALLGGGSLWQLHEKREERSDYLKCVETYTSAPYSMPPQEAAMVCGGQVEGGFKFGVNAKSFLLIAGSVFGMWFVTQLMITAAKSKLGGKK